MLCDKTNQGEKLLTRTTWILPDLQSNQLLVQMEVPPSQLTFNYKSHLISSVPTPLPGYCEHQF